MGSATITNGLPSPGSLVMKNGMTDENRRILAFNKRHSLLYASIMAQKEREMSGEDRVKACDTLCGYLLMMEIALANLSQGWAYRIYSHLQEQGMLRHTLKKNAKALFETATDLQKQSNRDDRGLIRSFGGHIFPAFTDDYLEMGGSVNGHIQATFDKLLSPMLDRVFFCTKNAYDRDRIAHSDILSEVSVMSLIAYSGIEFYDIIHRKMVNLMDGFGQMHSVKSRHNEKMLGYAKELIRLLSGGDRPLTGKAWEDARTLAAQFQEALAGEVLATRMNECLLAASIAYTDFAVASLRILMHRGQLRFAHYRTLFARMGDKGAVRKLLADIASYPYDEGSGQDALDLVDFFQSDAAPPFAEDAAITVFRQLCVQGKYIKVHEDPKQVLMRTLRQEARKNGGVVSYGTMKKLYQKLRTKKAVVVLLREAGLKESAKQFESFKAKILAA